jgi:glycosyltransferase involved in cell wall biosynthesis
MKAEPWASVIISSYNYGRFLRAAIDSALMQTYRHTEVIVVDDGSSDQSREIIASYGDRITPLFKPNGGQASALNAGYALCRGEVILFLDSDDALLPTAAENVLPAFCTLETVKVHWKLRVIDEAGRPTGQLRPHFALPEGDLREDRIRNGVPYHGDWPATSGNAWSRRLLDRILPIPEAEFRTCPDIYLSVLAPVFGLIRRLDEPQSCYREHGRNHWDAVSLGDFVALLDRSFVALRSHLESMGCRVSMAPWQRTSWAHQVHQAKQELTATIPEGERFVLVDQDELRPEMGAGVGMIPFLERDGEYWGPPLDGASALREFERLRRSGAGFMVFAWPAFWWLGHYEALTRHLRTNFRCVLENERVVVFDLHGRAAWPAGTAAADTVSG